LGIQNLQPSAVLARTVQVLLKTVVAANTRSIPKEIEVRWLIDFFDSFD
jgi:hypothetical protein